MQLLNSLAEPEPCYLLVCHSRRVEIVVASLDITSCLITKRERHFYRTDERRSAENYTWDPCTCSTPLSESLMHGITYKEAVSIISQLMMGQLDNL